MFYLIDYDKRIVEYQSESCSVLDEYKKLSPLAYAIISTEDELVTGFSIEELTELHSNLGGYGTPPLGADEEDIGELCWNIMMDTDFPLMTVVRKTKSNGPKQVGSTEKGLYILGSKTPKAGTLHSILTDYVEENGATHKEELIEEFTFHTGSTEKKANGYVAGALRRNYLEKIL